MLAGSKNWTRGFAGSPRVGGPEPAGYAGTRGSSQVRRVRGFGGLAGYAGRRVTRVGGFAG